MIRIIVAIVVFWAATSLCTMLGIELYNVFSFTVGHFWPDGSSATLALNASTVIGLVSAVIVYRAIK